MLWRRLSGKGGNGLYCNLQWTASCDLKKKIRSSGKFNLGRNRVFQQDPQHTFKLVTKWLTVNRTSTFAWPSQSSDPSPVENLWTKLKFVSEQEGQRT